MIYFVDILLVVKDDKIKVDVFVRREIAWYTIAKNGSSNGFFSRQCGRKIANQPSCRIGPSTGKYAHHFIKALHY
jgi:hypothetical protein